MLRKFMPWLFTALVIWGGSPARGDGLPDRIISASPSWTSFTNRDGTGLYHEILAGIFSPLGIRVEHRYTNANRGVHLIRKGLADVYTCRNNTYGFDDLILGRHPMYEGKFYAIFKKSRIPGWHGIATLTGRKVIWRRGYYDPREFKASFDVLETDSGTAALAQIVLERGDFYIDDLNLIRDSISQSQFAVPMEEYEIKPVGSRTYHPVFKDSPRGRQLKDLFDRGIEQLHRSGQLQKIFEKWHHPYPEYHLP